MGKRKVAELSQYFLSAGIKHRPATTHNFKDLFTYLIMCLCISAGVSRAQKRAFDPLKLELQETVSLPDMDAGI